MSLALDRRRVTRPTPTPTPNQAPGHTAYHIVTETNGHTVFFNGVAQTHRRFSGEEDGGVRRAKQG